MSSWTNYWTKQCHNPEYYSCNIHCQETLKFHIISEFLISWSAMAEEFILLVCDAASYPRTINNLYSLLFFKHAV